jgi:hypothetical protein
MIDEIAVERVRLFCPEDHWQQRVDVDVVRYADPDGGLWEYFSIDGDPVMSPYTADGRPLCPVCGRTTAARLLRRRLVPVPRRGQLRSRWENRPERAAAPLLQARPEQDRA